ncbi:MAG: Gfo/Idh/MocA family oxidoreductase [Firmicutes bacterium]|nr:Gfo/Idh/MocA family oxidoreductase [Candidatus Colimorpha enterica]
MDKVKVGIIGIGNMGSAHALNITTGNCPELELTAVADTSKARREWAAKELPDSVKIFDNADAMLNSGLIEAVIIAVPHYYHPVYAMKAFKHKLHVMSEKPAGVYTKQVKEMNAAAKEAGVVFGLMFNQRTNHVYRKMKELVDSGKYGQIRRVNWLITNWYRPQAYYDSGSWRATWSGEGGGVLLNQCPHNLDLWQWICGMPVKISAHMAFGKWHDIEVEDDVTIYAEYANGATGTFITSTGDLPGDNRFEITMDGATLIVENDKLKVIELEKSIDEFSATNTDVFGRPKATTIFPETDGLNQQHIGVLNAFASAILHGTPLVARGEEGINGLTISNAAHLSAWLGKEIDLPFDDDLYYEELMKRVATSRRKPEFESKVADTRGTYGVAEKK